MILKNALPANPGTGTKMPPNHNKRLEHRLAANEIEIALLEMKPVPLHPVVFCEAIEYCKYAALNCLYGQRKCYYEM